MNKHQIEFSKGVRGIERKQYFEQPGATAADWMGGRKLVTIDRKKNASKMACRRQVFTKD